jgi:hypothetical protein
LSKHANQRRADFELLDRDPGLDFLRALSVVCMTAAHFSYHLPHLTAASRILQFFFELAPPLFFFSFGMTFDRFFSKGPAEMRVRSRRFFYLTLCVNLLFHRRLLASDFFWFLWFWQAAAALAESFAGALTRLWGLMTVLIAAALFIFPFTSVSNVFSLGMPGSFPLIPWGGLVLAGIVFSRLGGKPARDLLIGAILLSAGLGLGQAGRPEAWSNLALIRWPMSGPYFLTGLGFVIFVTSAVRLWAPVYYSLTRISKACEYISKNLLLFVVLHFAAYVPVVLFMGIFGGMDQIRAHPGLDAAFLLIGGAASAAVLVLMVMAAKALWPAVKNAWPFKMARKNFDLTAILMIAAVTLFGGDATHVPTAWTFTLTDAAIWFMMWYFALEMKQSSDEAGL